MNPMKPKVAIGSKFSGQTKMLTEQPWAMKQLSWDAQDFASCCNPKVDWPSFWHGFTRGLAWGLAFPVGTLIAWVLCYGIK